MKITRHLKLTVFLFLFSVLSIVIVAQENADSSAFVEPTPDAYPAALSKTIIGPENADSSAYLKPALNAYPYVFYTPETQLAFGGGGVFTFFTQKDRALNPFSH